MDPGPSHQWKIKNKNLGGITFYRLHGKLFLLKGGT